MRELNHVNLESAFIDLNNLYLTLHRLNIKYIEALKKGESGDYPLEEANSLIRKFKKLKKEIQTGIKAQHEHIMGLQETIQERLDQSIAEVELSKELAAPIEKIAVTPQILMVDVPNGYFLKEAKKRYERVKNRGIVELLEISRYEDSNKIKSFSDINLCFCNLEYKGAKTGLEVLTQARQDAVLHEKHMSLFACTMQKSVSSIMQRTLKSLDVSLLTKEQFAETFKAHLKLVLKR